MTMDSYIRAQFIGARFLNFVSILCLVGHKTITHIGHKPLKVGNPYIFKSYLHRHLQWELATDH